MIESESQQLRERLDAQVKLDATRKTIEALKNKDYIPPKTKISPDALFESEEWEFSEAYTKPEVACFLIVEAMQLARETQGQKRIRILTTEECQEIRSKPILQSTRLINVEPVLIKEAAPKKLLLPPNL